MRIGVKLLPLACCAVEASVGMELLAAVKELEVLDFQPGQKYDQHVLMVAGTITKNSAAAVLAAWDELPEPKRAVAYGVCATSGGPYWDSYSVVAGAEKLIPVAAFIPGCPPPPSTILPVLQQLFEVAADA